MAQAEAGRRDAQLLTETRQYETDKKLYAKKIGENIGKFLIETSARINDEEKKLTVKLSLLRAGDQLILGVTDVSFIQENSGDEQIQSEADASSTPPSQEKSGIFSRLKELFS